MPKNRKPRRTRLEKLQNSWLKASADERRQFLGWMQGLSGDGAEDAGAFPRMPAPITTGRYLTPDAAARIRARLKARGMSLADLNREMDLGPDDPSLARALVARTSLRLSVVARLERWLAD
jgi:lambda repressor-like predicted transcriptional regulator